VVTASGLADDDYIYAGTHSTSATYAYIYRWQIGVSSAWTKITAASAVPAGYKAFGISLQDGILYVITANDEDSCLFRTLSPTLSPTVYWSTVNSTAELDVEPQGLKVGGGSNKLWAIDSEDNALFSFTDTLATAVPTLTSPKNGYVDKINKISGYATDITFAWEKPSDYVTEYNLYIYDADGNRVFADDAVSSSSAVSFVVGKDITAGDSSGTFSFQPGESYSWKVRVSSDGLVYSNYSEERDFTIEVATTTPPVTITQAPAMPEIVIPAPEVTVTVPPTPTPEPAPAPIAPIYLWIIIAIGAILVIALIILIVRTRRVV